MLIQLVHFHNFVTKFASAQEGATFGQMQPEEILALQPWVTLLAIGANTFGENREI
jgi:hypothetical protein